MSGNKKFLLVSFYYKVSYIVILWCKTKPWEELLFLTLSTRQPHRFYLNRPYSSIKKKNTY